MSKLEALKITECPYAFASVAEKHNALVDLLASMVGQNGITVVVSEKNAIIRGNIANSVGGIGGIANLAYASVVSANGRLQNVLCNTNVSNTYPAEGKWVTPSGNITISNVGLTLSAAGGKTCTIAFAAITQNVSIRTEAYCNNNSSANILIAGSAPF